MTIVQTVSYPRVPDESFNVSYYLNHHMPLVQRKWGPHGMRSYHVVQLEAPAPYVIVTTAYWDSMEGVKEAVARDSEEVFADQEHYTTKAPDILVGVQIGGS